MLNNYDEKLVTDNLKLVHYFLHKLGIYDNHPYYEDLVQIGNIGLIKAAKTYDETHTFSTYAAYCIQCEILMELRKSKKQKHYDSLDEYELPIPDQYNFLEEFHNDELITIYKDLEIKYKEFLNDYLSGMNQYEIAKKYHISQPTAYRRIRAAKEDLKLKMKNYV